MLRRIATLAAAALLGAALLAGCSSPDGELVSKTPFPEFSAVDTDGESIGSDVFGDWDATIVNFWNNAWRPTRAKATSSLPAPATSSTRRA